MKNVTLSLPEDLLSKSRAYAAHHGTTLNQMIRELLKRNVTTTEESVVQSLIDHTQRTAVSMKGQAWNREDAYEK
jgi:plasmid stability protein